MSDVQREVMAKVPSMGPTASARCGACGVGFTSRAWARLEVSTLLAPAEIRGLVLGWPDDVCVEVRVCSACRGLIATKRRAGSR